MKSFVRFLPCLFLLTGCASHHYVPYVGQQKLWKTANAAFVEEETGIKIYHGFPDRPYNVLGQDAIVGGGNYFLAHVAHQHGADAIIITDTQTMNAGSVSIPGSSTTTYTGSSYASGYSGTANTYTSPGFTIPVVSTITSAWFIKFKTAKEIAEQDGQELDLYYAWAVAHPDGGTLPGEDGKPVFFGPDKIALIKANIESKRLNQKETPWKPQLP